MPDETWEMALTYLELPQGGSPLPFVGLLCILVEGEYCDHLQWHQCMLFQFMDAEGQQLPPFAKDITFGLHFKHVSPCLPPLPIDTSP